MAHKLISFLTLTLALLTTPISALPNSPNAITLSPRTNDGINCDGSIACGGYKDGDLSNILAKVNQIAQGTSFNAGDNLACAGNEMFSNSYGVALSQGGARGETQDGVCAMMGHNLPATFVVGPSANGQSNSAADIIADLQYHGCEACGTAPTNRVGNNLADGSLVVNYVQHVCYYSENNPCGR